MYVVSSLSFHMIKPSTRVVIIMLAVKKLESNRLFQQHNKTLTKCVVALYSQYAICKTNSSSNDSVPSLCHLFHWSVGNCLCFLAHTGTRCVIGVPRDAGGRLGLSGYNLSHTFISTITKLYRILRKRFCIVYIVSCEMFHRWQYQINL